MSSNGGLGRNKRYGSDLSRDAGCAQSECQRWSVNRRNWRNGLHGRKVARGRESDRMVAVRSTWWWRRSGRQPRTVDTNTSSRHFNQLLRVRSGVLLGLVCLSVATLWQSPRAILTVDIGGNPQLITVVLTAAWLFALKARLKHPERVSLSTVELGLWLLALAYAWLGLPSRISHLALLSDDAWANVLEAVERLAWPLFAVVALLVLRDPLKNLLTRIENLEGPGTKVGFAAAAQNTREESEALVSDTDKDARESDSSAPEPTDDVQGASRRTEHSRQEHPARRHPSVLELEMRDHERDHRDRPRSRQRDAIFTDIVEAWVALEQDARGAIEMLQSAGRYNGATLKGRPVLRVPVMRAFDVLVRLEALPPEVISVARRTQQLRNQLMHEGTGRFDLDSFRDLLATIENLRTALNSGVRDALAQ